MITFAANGVSHDMFIVLKGVDDMKEKKIQQETCLPATTGWFVEHVELSLYG